MVTMKKKLDEKEIKEVFETLQIPITEKEPKTFEVWDFVKYCFKELN